MKFSIRFLVAALAGATLLISHAADAVGTGPGFKGPIGLQLYSLRAHFIKNVPDTLAKVKAYGIRDVELAGTYNLAPDKFRELLLANGLNPVSAHFAFERLRDDIEGVARDSKVLGVKYVGCAWVPHEGDFDEAECRKAIEVFNQSGAALAKQGLQFFYHAHGYEFQPHTGGTLFDLMMKETDAKNVKFQMDVLWIVFPGQDPVKLLQKYPGRWDLMHLKDLKRGVKTGELTGKTDVNNDVVLGTGQMDWPAILKQARQSGVKYYFIEDESANAVDQIPQSLRFLESVKW